MKNIKLILGMILVSTLSLTSCSSSDDAPIETTTIIQKELNEGRVVIASSTDVSVPKIGDSNWVFFRKDLDGKDIYSYYTKNQVAYYLINGVIYKVINTAIVTNVGEFKE